MRNPNTTSKKVDRGPFRFSATAIAIVLIATMAVFASAKAPNGATGVSDPAHRIEAPGLPNAAQVTATVYRGAQPEPAGYAELKNMGVDIVVDFRDQPSQARDEKTRVEASGMKFVSIPWSAHYDPTRAQLLAFFGVLRDNPQKKVFVHCEAGADRTGTMIALYRVGLDRWTPDQAVAEMKLFHFHYVRFGHLAKYVQNFPSALSVDNSLLAGFAPATEASIQQ